MTILYCLVLYFNQLKYIHPEITFTLILKYIISLKFKKYLPCANIIHSF